MKNKTTNKLIWIGALAMFLFGGNQAFAYVPGVWDPHPRVNSNPTFTTVVSSAYTTPVQTTTNTVYPVSYSNSNTTNTGNSTNNGSNVSSQANNQNQVKTVATNTNTNKTVTNSYTTSSTRTSIPPVNTVNTMGYTNQSGIGGGIYPNANTNANANELTALSLRGSGSFMPSSIWQWLLVVFLILVIIILSRILTRRHDVHEVHTVAHH